MISNEDRINQLINSPSNIILENIDIDGELTEYLYSNQHIKSIYLINYAEDIRIQLVQSISTKEIINIKQLTPSILQKELVSLYCLDNSNSFNPNFALISNTRNVRAICFLGFEQGVFVNQIKSDNCLILYESVKHFINKSRNIKPFQDKNYISKARECHNRTEEKKALTDFLANSNNRLLVIHGFPGYGKSNLVEELKRKAPNREYIQFQFESHTDSYKDIVYDIAPYLTLDASIEALEQTRIQERTKRDLVNQFIDKFNSRENSTIIFEAVQNIIQPHKSDEIFKSYDLKVFFRLLITHSSFNDSNKIIFVSRVPIALPDDFKRYSVEVKVRELLPHYIKLIMADEYNRINKPRLSQQILRFNDDSLIQSVLSGHPALALRFVDASLNFGLDELLNNKDFGAQISVELKIKWLMDNFPLEIEEKQTLALLALFTSEIPFKFITSHFDKPYFKLENLINRYLIDTRNYDDGSITYYVPNIIKDYIKAISDPKTLLDNHLKIGDFYWLQTIDINTSSRNKTHAYRKAFHHYRESKNFEKLKLLVTRLRDKFIIAATEAFRNRYWKEAYFYFYELHTHGQLSTSESVEYNMFFKTITQLEPITGTNLQLLSEIHNMFLDSPHIAVTYADYLFDTEQFEAAKRECLRIKELYIDTPGINELQKSIIDNTLAKSEFKLGNKSEAIALIEQWKQYYKKRGLNNLNHKEKYNYQALVMTEYEGLECYERYLKTKQILIKELYQGKISKIPFLMPNNRNMYCLDGGALDKINAQLELTKSIRADDKLRTAANNFHKNILTKADLDNYIASAASLTISAVVHNYLDEMDAIIEKGKTTLNQLFEKSNPHHFQSNYSLFMLLQVESDLDLIKTVLNVFPKPV